MRIPTIDEERAKYIASVMIQAKWRGSKCTNIEYSPRTKEDYERTIRPSWNWAMYNYRIVEPVKVRYINVYENGIGDLFASLQDCRRSALSGAVDRLRVTGESPGAKYESIGLEVTDE